MRRGWLALAVGLLCVLQAACVVGEADDKPADRAAAWRFLNHASFGPNEQAIQHLQDVGYQYWIDEQLDATPAISYTAFFRARQSQINAQPAGTTSTAINPYNLILEAFYTKAVTDDDAQLRHRLVFALSEMFVVSLNDGLLAEHPLIVATYLDGLDKALSGNYRQLLEFVSTSAAMGQYLSSRSNQKEEPALGRLPDENYAREVMQLFSIGLYQLNIDGTVVKDGAGKPIETYTSEDVKGLAKVFTGWSFHHSSAFGSPTDVTCFAWILPCRDPDAETLPMTAYPAFHSTSAKTFLGVTVPAQGTPDPHASMRAALDRLATHPNTAPFFSRQMIQRLVTSNPSPEYVSRVATRFVETDGNLREVFKAILLDQEAVSVLSNASLNAGKLREPVLRLTTLLRAFKPSANTLTGPVPYLGLYVTTELGQTPFFSGSVFNFFRPGYVPPLSGTAEKGLVAPEMQIVNEGAVTDYVNTVALLLSDGLGVFDVPDRRVRLDLTEQQDVAMDDDALVQHVADRLMGGTIPDSLRASLIQMLQSLPVPELDADQSNAAEVTEALDQRVKATILTVAVSPDFLIQK